MFTSVDKMVTAFLTTGVAYLVGSGALTEEQGLSLVAVLTTLAAAGISALLTYLVPNKS